MTDVKLFTTLDASNAFWQIEVDEEPFKLLTFNTPQGRSKHYHLVSTVLVKFANSKSETSLKVYLDVSMLKIIWGVSPEQMKTRTIRGNT